MDPIAWVTDHWNSSWAWMTTGGWAWFWMTMLVAGMWLSHWFSEANLKYWTAVAVASTGAACLLLWLNNLMGGSFVLTVDGGAISDRWLLTVGAFCWFYVAEHAKFSLAGGGGASASHH